MNILIIEDDKIFASQLEKTFYSYCFANRVEIIYSYQDFLHYFSNILSFDIVLIDICLGEEEEKTGLDILKHIRKKYDKIPIIINSAYSDYSFLEKAFEAGANDYIIKPYRNRELQIRIKRWFNNYVFLEYYSIQKTLSYGELDYNVSQYSFSFKEKELKLTRGNKYILSLFIIYKEKLLSHDFLSDKIWGYSEDIKEKNLRVKILRLKNQLSGTGIEAWVQTIRGEGYILKNSEL